MSTWNCPGKRPPHAGAAEQAIALHGRPALCRASGVCTTVLGGMLKYEPDQRIKPETWSKIQRGIEILHAKVESRSPATMCQHIPTS